MWDVATHGMDFDLGVPIQSWKKETFERIASLYGLAICVEDETLEPSSSGRGRVLIESTSLDRIEDQIEYMVMDRTLLEGDHTAHGTESVNSKDSDVGNSYEEYGEAHSDDDASFKGQGIFLPLAWVRGRLLACGS
ncbi:hypothetical protein V6N13_037827 [Hibiscus sabdariffa]|uniref:DUF4283 domain-containing protein n=1 Tax=Hibiscus sabdariffa TaxID=183260 RepID=A0ABR2S4D1_9ROSI